MPRLAAVFQAAGEGEAAAAALREMGLAVRLVRPGTGEEGLGDGAVAGAAVGGTLGLLGATVAGAPPVGPAVAGAGLGSVVGGLLDAALPDIPEGGLLLFVEAPPEQAEAAAALLRRLGGEV